MPYTSFTSAVRTREIAHTDNISYRTLSHEVQESPKLAAPNQTYHCSSSHSLYWDFKIGLFNLKTIRASYEILCLCEERGEPYLKVGSSKENGVMAVHLYSVTSAVNLYCVTSAVYMYIPPALCYQW